MQLRVDIAVNEQRTGRGVVGVIGDEVAIGVDNGVCRLEASRRAIHLIDQSQHIALKRHGDTRTADRKRADRGDRPGDLHGGERLIDKVQPKVGVEVVVELCPVIGGPRRQRDTQLRFIGDAVDAHRRVGNGIRRQMAKIMMGQPAVSHGLHLTRAPKVPSMQSALAAHQQNSGSSGTTGPDGWGLHRGRMRHLSVIAAHRSLD